MPNPKVELHIANHGVVTLELDADKAPQTTKNFVDYVKAGHYDGTIFHRVIDGFMIPGGGFTPGMSQKPTNAPIQNEANTGLKNAPYSVAMARTSDPNSATAQFFINHKDNPSLDHSSKDVRGWGYAVFGRVVDGMDVVDAIATVQTGVKNRMRDVPLETVTIESVSRVAPAH